MFCVCATRSNRYGAVALQRAPRTEQLTGLFVFRQVKLSYNLVRVYSDGYRQNKINSKSVLLWLEGHPSSDPVEKEMAQIPRNRNMPCLCRTLLKTSSS